MPALVARGAAAQRPDGKLACQAESGGRLPGTVPQGVDVDHDAEMRELGGRLTGVEGLVSRGAVERHAGKEGLGHAVGDVHLEGVFVRSHLDALVTEVAGQVVEADPGGEDAVLHRLPAPVRRLEVPELEPESA